MEITQKSQNRSKQIYWKVKRPWLSWLGSISSTKVERARKQPETHAIIPDAKAIRLIEMHLQLDEHRARENTRFQRLLVAWVVHNKIQKYIKRGFDLLVALGGLPLLFPFMLITAIAIKLDTPGPIIFKQVRVGKWGKTFNCYKFRSMFIDAEARKAELMVHNEADEVVFKMKRDPRVTRIGRIIRKLSIDELPQIFNVIKGDMSLVGPRPPVPIEVEDYQFDQYRRLDTIPGITGLQQISGRSELSFKRWVELDVQYIKEQSLKKDIEIILKTIPAVISGRGAY
jgi:lipopolysaccharide/colanic/teichoic acid biosynthesis glycosyltransferase